MAESKSAALPLGYAPPVQICGRTPGRAEAAHLTGKALLPQPRPGRRLGRRHRIGDMPEIPLIRAREPVAQRGRRRPAEGVDAANIEELLRGAVRLVERVDEAAAVTDDFGDETRELVDGDVAAAADIDMRLCRVVLHQEDYRVGEVVDVEELAARLAAAPDLHRRGPIARGAMNLADQRGDDVTLRRMEIVARTVDVGRHRRNVVAAVLPAPSGTSPQPGGLGDRIPLVGRLERTGEQRLLAHRLRREPRIDA